MSRPFVVLLVLVAFASTAHATRNAAEYYSRAWSALDRLPTADWGLIKQAARSPEPSPGARAAVRRAASAFHLIKQASARPYSDFALDYSSVATMQTSHLPQMVRLSVLLEAQVRVETNDGNHDAATAAIACAYGMGHHLSQDNVEMSLVIARQLVQSADRSHQYMIDRAAIGPAQAPPLMRAIDRFDASSTLQTIDTLVFSATNMLDWYAELVEEEDLNALGGYLQVFSPDLKVESIEHAQESVDHARQQIDDVVQALMSGNVESVSALFAAGSEMSNDQLACVMLESMFQSAPSHLMAERKLTALLKQRRQELVQLLAGDIETSSGQNAALLYRRAADQWRDLEATSRESVATTLEEEAGWRAVRPVLDTLETAAAAPRCDFSALVPHMPGAVDELTFADRAYLPDMKLLLGLVRKDVERAARATDESRTVEMTAVHLRMIAHLVQARTLGSSLVATDAFNATASMIDSKRSAAGSDAVREAIALFSKADPFGFVDACQRHHRGFSRLFRQELVALPDNERTLYTKRLDGWGTDDLLNWMIVYDAAARPRRNVDLGGLEELSPSFERNRVVQSALTGDGLVPELSLSEVIVRLDEQNPWANTIGRKSSDSRSAFAQWVRMSSSAPYSSGTHNKLEP